VTEKTNNVTEQLQQSNATATLQWLSAGTQTNYHADSITSELQ